MHSTPYIEIDTKKIVANYDVARNNVGAKCDVAAVVKANACGLGASEIAKQLTRVGCTEFYVVYLDEYLAIKPFIGNADVFVLMISSENELDELLQAGAIPVLSTFELIEIFKKLCNKHGKNYTCALHIDTGMNRHGISFKEIEKLEVAELNIKYILSHLACSDDSSHHLNALQLERVRTISESFNKPISFCNSDGIFLGADYHFTQVRPGCMLYGVGGKKGRGIQNPLTWYGKVIQLRDIEKGESVSYGARYVASELRRIATVACGYADGYKRTLTNQAHGYYKGYKLPQVGTVTMGMIMFDVSSVPENLLSEMNYIELLNDSLLIDDLAILCNTIGYEIITSLGNRIRRVYK